jgi:hypothetical protein
LPPNGLSGLRWLLESFDSVASVTLGMPASGFLQIAHFETAFFLPLKRCAVLPPGVLTLSFLRDLERKLLRTICINS